MQSREEIKKAILANKEGIIEFRSYFGHTGHSRRLVPKPDPTNGWYKGIDKITEEEKMKTTKPFIDPKDPNNTLAVAFLKNGDQYDLGNEIHRMKLKWIFERDDAVALTQEEGASNPKITFYVYNKETDVKKRVSKLELKDTAIEMLRKLSQDDLYMAARLMGYRMDKAEPNEVRLFIRELFENKKQGYTNAEKFLAVINDRNKEIKTFAFKAMDKGFIEKTNRGEYKYKDIFIGFSFESVISWLQDIENKDLVILIQEELGEHLPTKTAKSSKK